MMKKTLQSTAKSHVGIGQAMSRRHWNAQRRVIVAPMHATHNITVLPGDGIGPEIMAVALEVLREAGKKEGETFECTEALIGGAAVDAANNPYPKETEDLCKASDAVLLAAIGGYKWDDLPYDMKPEKGLLRLRASLNAFANLRPAIVLPQLADASTLKREVVEGVDILIVRELVGGIYFGEPRGIEERNGERIGYNTDIYSESEVQRIARVAFEAARKRNSRLCSVDKSNVLEVSRLWRESVTALGEKEYPDVDLSHMYIDNAAMQLIRNPKSFDTIVTGNIFGDILSDEASMLTGSLGMLPSASISDDGPGIFEPVHGSAPDIAGQDLANPLAMTDSLLTVVIMTFWGCKVTKSKESAYVPPADGDILLHVSQACLDPEAKKGAKAVLLLKSSDEGPYAVCSLREGGTESVSLDLLLEDYSEFSVVGSASIHLTGYLMPRDDEGVEGFSDEDEDDEFDDAFEEATMNPALLGYDAEGLPIYMDDGSDDSDEIDSDEEEEEADDDIVPEKKNKKVIIEDVTDHDDVDEKPAEKARKEKATTEDKKAKRKAKEDTREAQKKPKQEEPVAKTKSKKYPNGFEIHELHQGGGSGKLAKPGKRVSVRYIGKLLNGKIFDQTKGKKTFQFRLGVGEVIKGWDRGVEGMRVGDKRKLVVPPQMGYGGSKVGPIPANSTLVFEVELVDVKN
eukprot:jgi/Picre1/32487/NNA_007833.t1